MAEQTHEPCCSLLGQLLRGNVGQRSANRLQERNCGLLQRQGAIGETAQRILHAVLDTGSQSQSELVGGHAGVFELLAEILHALDRCRIASCLGQLFHARHKLLYLV
ncbi:hypothetical protein, partial [Pseudomonas aeruginosa]|uniref:hypothetical protein n=1 Tax=Pseudomonas aeruginosa TaxID=287 RepID=UPI00163CD840